MLIVDYPVDYMGIDTTFSRILDIKGKFETGR
jgi:hypothetical protein